MDEIAIKIEHVSKEYRLGAIGGGTLRGDLQSWLAKIRGKEDPNLKIGDSRDGRSGDRFLALDDVSFEVKKGEAVGIIGHNGAGKSTLLKLLSRVTAPTSGKICYNGRIASMLEVGTGFHPELTGRENVYMNGAILGMTKAEIDKKFDDIVAFAEMEKFIDTPVKRYSSGMYVKLAFSVAAHLDSEIMIMDEVLAVGDMKFQQKCLGRMGDAANSEGRTVLYVSHNMNTIRQLCSRCIVLDHGSVIFDGDVEKAIEIYMNQRMRDELRIYCDNFDRPAWFLPKIKVTMVEYLGKEDVVFKDNEPIILHFLWKNLADVENIGLLIEVCSLDDIAQATYALYDFYSGKQGEEAECVLELDSWLLAEAMYKMRYTFFVKNSFGVGTSIDWLNGLCFMKENTNNGEKLQWHTKQWGYIQMPTPNVRAIK